MALLKFHRTNKAEIFTEPTELLGYKSFEFDPSDGYSFKQNFFMVEVIAVGSKENSHSTTLTLSDIQADLNNGYIEVVE